MSKLGLSQEEELKLKTLCEYLFFDQFKDIATYPRFEMCFEPLLSKCKISIDTVFKEICGPKRKYITYKRFLNSYLKYKSNSKEISNDLKVFFDKLMNEIVQKENSFVGKNTEKCLICSTTKANKKRQCITLVQIFSDKDGGIHGLNIEYDEVFNNKMYPSKIEDNLLISLEMNLGILDEKFDGHVRSEKNEKLLNEKKEKLYRDSITHIFGTIDKEKKNIITFLGFKCVSGKTVFVGKPNGESFLFGKFGTKFHQVKLQMTEEGITKLEPIFNENPRPNFYLNCKVDDITAKDLEEDELILDEEELSKLNNENDIDKLITTPLLEDNHFFNKKFEDKISGYDYKEVVNQVPRQWLLNQRNLGRVKSKPISSVNDALKEFEIENKNRLNTKKKVLPKDKNKRGNTPLRGGLNKGMKKLHKSKKIGKGNQTENKKSIDDVTKLKPSEILTNRENYKALKNKLAKSIQEDIMEKEGDNFSNSKEALLEQIIPEIKEIKGVGKDPFYQISQQSQVTLKQKKLKPRKLLITNKSGQTEVFKKKLSGTISDPNSSEEEIIVSNVHYSDALQMFKDLSNNEDDDEDNLFGFGMSEKYFPELNRDESNTSNKLRGGRYTYAPLPEGAAPRATKNYSLYISGSNKTSKYVYDPEKYAESQKQWKFFSQELKKVNGVYLLQTMGSIIKAVHSFKMDEEGKNKLSLEEKVKLMKLLQENEVIINFLAQEKKQQVEETNEEEESDEDEEEEILLPDEHPEKITSLSELEQKLSDLNKILEDIGLSETNRAKIEKLKNLYLQQKNILIENETKKVQEEIANKIKIDLEKIIKEEEEKRIKAEEEAQRLLEEKRKEEEAKEEAKKKEIQLKEAQQPKKIYKNQELYKETDPWTDPLFPPEKKSLCPFDSSGWVFPEGVTKQDISGWDYYDWYRVENILGTDDFKVFEEGISADDIRQGNIGDCYFLSAIGSLCKFPKLLAKLFFCKEKTKEHVYGIYIFINGQWELVLVDDYFPAIGSRFNKVKRYSFASSEAREIWINLLEKAWAKINGCYGKIACGGKPNEVFDVLTEALTESLTINKKNSEQLWEKMIDSEKKGYVMTAGTAPKIQGAKIEDYGLAPSHAYSVLGVLEIDTGKGTERVIKLRNPWGNFEYSGEWGDSSSKWTEELKEKYNFVQKNDGDFYMSFKDFLIFYAVMGFAKLHQDYITTVMRIEKDKAVKCQLLKLKVPASENGVHTFLQLYQKNPRIILRDGTYQKTTLCFLILVDKDFNYITSTSSNKMHIGIEQTLKEGEYYLFCDLNYRYESNNTIIHGYNVTSYGEKEINWENVTDKMDVNECLRKAMIDYCKKNVTKNRSSGTNIYVSKSYNDDLPFTVAYFENESTKNNKVVFDVKSRGDKSFCFYCDEIATEEDTALTKELPANGYCITLIMNYNSSSLFTLNYLVRSSTTPVTTKTQTTTSTSTNKTTTDTKKIEKTSVELKSTPFVKKTTKELFPKGSGRKITDSNIVFNEIGEPIYNSEEVFQYVLEINGGYIIGIENKSNRKLKIQLKIEGIELTDASCKGRDAPTFYIDPKGKKTFNALIKRRYTGRTSFKFLVL